MNDLIEIARVEGELTLPRRRPLRPRRQPGRGPAPDRDGVPEAEPVPEVDLRQRRLRPPHRRASKGNIDDIVERALRGAGLWDEVKDRLKASAMGLSGGQQQRLCIARAIAVDPEVILMDEPCSALDPIATGRIEDLMQEIKSEYTIVIVTHNMQQAARVSDRSAFFTTEVNETSDTRTGLLVEFDTHRDDVLQPQRRADRELRHRPVRLSMTVAAARAPAPRVRAPSSTSSASRSSSWPSGSTRTSSGCGTSCATGDAAPGRHGASAADDDIDAMNVSLTERCYDLLAREAPVASDLRFVVSVLRVLASSSGSATSPCGSSSSRPSTTCSCGPTRRLRHPAVDGRRRGRAVPRRAAGLGDPGPRPGRPSWPPAPGPWTSSTSG